MQARACDRAGAVRLPGGHPGVHGAMIAVDARRFPPERLAALGGPVALDAAVQVEAMYSEPHARIDPHSAPNPILFVVVTGAGFVRVGDEARAVAAGEAARWPAGREHTAWPEGEGLQAIVVKLPQGA